MNRDAFAATLYPTWDEWKWVELGICREWPLGGGVSLYVVHVSLRERLPFAVFDDHELSPARVAWFATYKEAKDHAQNILATAEVLP